MEKILKALLMKVDIFVEDETTATSKENLGKRMAQTLFDMKLLGGKKMMTINTGVLEQKISASNAIHALSKHFGKAYFPYVAKTFEAISQLFDYKYSKVN